MRAEKPRATWYKAKGQQLDTITDQSPVGRALLGHRVGETVEVEGPRGKFDIKILEVGV